MTLAELNELLRREGLEPVKSEEVGAWIRSGRLHPPPQLAGRRFFDLAHYDVIKELATSPVRHRRGRPPRHDGEKPA